MDNEAPTIGHNQGPPLLLVGEPLRERLTDENADLIKRKNDLLAAADRMPIIDGDHAASAITDFVRQISAAIKAADGRRIAAKEPYLAGGRGVDGLFSAIIIPLQNAKQKAERDLTLYMRAKEAAARRVREEAQRLAWEEAERKKAEARRQAEEMQNAKALDDAVAADKAARLAEADAVKADKAAEVKPAELSRTRGEFGAVGSLRVDWTFGEINRDTLDLEALRQHIPRDGLERAIRSFIKAGGRELAGTEIYEQTSAVVR